MASLKEVRGRIVSVNSTQQITKAMKMVSASKLRRAQDNIIKIRPYAEKLAGILNNISATLDADIENPFSAVREAKKVLIIVVTSDRGLAGAFNSNVIKSAVSLMQTSYASQAAAGNVTFLCIGKKGMDFFNKKSYPLLNHFATVFQNLNFDSSRQAAEFAMEAFTKGTYDKVDIVYNEFKNVATQVVKNFHFLPVEEKKEIVLVKKPTAEVDYIFEPSKEFIIRELIPKSLKIQFYKALLESNASEHGARMTAMDKATENAKDLIKELKLTYNRTRQAAITKEILEIVGGAEALNN